MTIDDVMKEANAFEARTGRKMHVLALPPEDYDALVSSCRSKLKYVGMKPAAGTTTVAGIQVQKLERVVTVSFGYFRYSPRWGARPW